MYYTSKNYCFKLPLNLLYVFTIVVPASSIEYVKSSIFEVKKLYAIMLVLIAPKKQTKYFTLYFHPSQ